MAMMEVFFKAKEGDREEQLSKLKSQLVSHSTLHNSLRQIAESTEATGMVENKTAAKTGGSIAKRARLELKEKTRQRWFPVKTIYLLYCQQA
jgi:hypothetical protein